MKLKSSNACIERYLRLNRDLRIVTLMGKLIFRFPLQQERFSPL